MSAAHVLEQDAHGSYRVVLHVPVPGGANAAGLPWKDVALAAGRTGTTCLQVGKGPGQITDIEAASIAAGDTAEIVTSLPLESTAWTAAKVTGSYKAITDEWLSRIAKELNRYGQVVG